MGDEFVGDSELRFQVILGLGKVVTLNDAHLLVHPVFPAGNVGKEARDAVVARCGVVIKVDRCFSGDTTHFVFEFADHHGVVGFFSRLGITAFIDESLGARVVEGLSPFDRQDQVVVGFVEMDNAHAVYLWLPWVLFQHCVDYSVPALIGIATLNGVV